MSDRTRIYIFRQPGSLPPESWQKLKLIGGILLGLYVVSLLMAGPEVFVKSATHFFIFLPILLFSLSFHECAHAAMASFLGDNTARDRGRLSLNPMNHLDLVGTTMLLFANFGWAKPVPVDPRNFRVPGRAMMSVSLMGPVSNLFLAFIGGVLLKGTVMLHASYPISDFLMSLLLYGFQAAIVLNLALAIFNIIPIPPLDGSKVLSYFISRRNPLHTDNMEATGPFILILLVAFGLLNPIMDPPLNFMYEFVLKTFNLP